MIIFNKHKWNNVIVEYSVPSTTHRWTKKCIIEVNITDLAII